MRDATWCFVVALLFLYSCTNNNDANTNNVDKISLSKFVIGKWEGEKQTADINGNYVQEYQVEFINENTLTFAMRSPYDGFNDKFTYRFLTDNTISVENVRATGGQWKIDRVDDTLLICIWSNDNCSTFHRVASNKITLYLWLLGSLTLILFVAVMARHYYSVRTRKHK